MSIIKYGKRIYRQKRYGRVIGNTLDKVVLALGAFTMSIPRKYVAPAMVLPKRLKELYESLLS